MKTLILHKKDLKVLSPYGCSAAEQGQELTAPSLTLLKMLWEKAGLLATPKGELVAVPPAEFAAMLAEHKVTQDLVTFAKEQLPSMLAKAPTAALSEAEMEEQSMEAAKKHRAKRAAAAPKPQEEKSNGKA